MSASGLRERKSLRALDSPLSASPKTTSRLLISPSNQIVYLGTPTSLLAEEDLSLPSTNTATAESSCCGHPINICQAVFDSSKTVFQSIAEFFDNMGACLSGAPKDLIEQTSGGEKEFHDAYFEDQVLGAGEFGEVKLVHKLGPDKKPQMETPLAMKTLKKGAVFKDNTLYSPIKPEVLQAEIEILRLLDGKHFCLYMEAVYESPRSLFVVTEFCGGGEMMEYVANRKEDLRTEDVSRIAYQLFDSVRHCAKHGVIHR